MSQQGISLVTGGGGFIGRHLVQALINRGKQVRILDLNPGSVQFKGTADIWNGSILDRDLVFNAMQGVSTVYHLAAIPHLWWSKPDDFYQVNVQGTQTILQVARKTGISKFVYTSSETVLRAWRNRSSEPINESQPLPDPEELPGPYSRSKLMAEQKVLRAVANGLPAVVVYPTIPIGAGDYNITPPTRMIRDFLIGKNIAFMECNLNLIPVQAVAEGHIAAAEHGKTGARYILGQENMKMSGLLKLIETQTGKKMPKRRVPYSMAYATARAMEYTSRFTNQIPQASVEGVRLAGANMIFDCSRAKSELDLAQYSIPKALAETVAWLEAEGHLKI